MISKANHFFQLLFYLSVQEGLDFRDKHSNTHPYNWVTYRMQVF